MSQIYSMESPINIAALSTNSVGHAHEHD